MPLKDYYYEQSKVQVVMKFNYLVLNNFKLLFIKNNFFILLLLLSLCKLSFAQAPPKPGNYVIDNNLYKFIGIWEGSSNGQYVLIKLKKVKYYYPAPFNFYVDVLIGCHQYTNNGVVVESSMQYIDATNLNQHFTLFGKSSATNGSVINMQFIDLTKKKTGQLTLTMNSGTVDQLTWSLEETEGVKIRSPNYGFTVPVNLIMDDY